MKNRPFITGILAVASPLPVFCYTILWSWFMCFGIGMGLLQYDTIPQWILTVSLLPLCISPGLSVAGMIHGIVKRKEKLAWLGILLSVLALVQFAALVYIAGYLGSKY